MIRERTWSVGDIIIESRSVFHIIMVFGVNPPPCRVKEDFFSALGGPRFFNLLFVIINDYSVASLFVIISDSS